MEIWNHFNYMNYMRMWANIMCIGFIVKWSIFSILLVSHPWVPDPICRFDWFSFKKSFVVLTMFLHYSVFYLTIDKDPTEGQENSIFLQQISSLNGFSKKKRYNFFSFPIQCARGVQPQSTFVLLQVNIPIRVKNRVIVRIVGFHSHITCNKSFK